jgi:uncharacterized protein YceH (UPF0502 family)
MTLSPEGGRILGCLVEKQLATPQQYPLTLNALVSAANQATNRQPIMALPDDIVQEALDELKLLRLVRFVLPSHGKSVTRYRHVLDEMYGLETDQVALLGVLLLRGPQTPGELRARTGRMAAFTSITAVQDQLDALARRTDPLVHLLPRRPGQKEDRWQQLLAEESAAEAPTAERVPSTGMEGDGESPASPPSPVTEGIEPVDLTITGARGSDLEGRIAGLASEMAELRDQLVELRATLDTLRESLGG